MAGLLDDQMAGLLAAQRLGLLGDPMMMPPRVDDLGTALGRKMLPHLSDGSTYAPLPPPSMEPNAAGKVPAVERDPRIEGAVADTANLAQNFAPFGGPVAGGALAAKAAIPLLGGLMARRGAMTAAKGAAEAAPQGIRAYHGSPHDFDRFDLSRIGTGEGAQSYGHGLYFAENEGVARSYRDTLAPHPVNMQYLRDTNGLEQELARLREMAQNAKEVAAKETDPKLRRWYEMTAAQAEKDLALQQRAMANPDAPLGRMYEVNINAKPEQFLDWDKPLSRQDAPVQSVLEQFGFKARPEEMRAHDDALLAALHGNGPTTLPKMPPDPLGANIYESSKIVPGGYRDRTAATQALREAGIPGIKYLDQGSRRTVTNPDIEALESVRRIAERDLQRAMDGNDAANAQRIRGGIRDIDSRIAQLPKPVQPPKTSNYVVFDDKLIDILRKYGLAGMLGGSGGLLASQNQPQGLLSQ